MSVAIGDVDGDGLIDIVAATGEGDVRAARQPRQREAHQRQAHPRHAGGTFGWGGGLSIADMDGDGFPEIVYGSTVFTTTGGTITLPSRARRPGRPDRLRGHLDRSPTSTSRPNGNLELLAGNTAYKSDGTVLWHAPARHAARRLPRRGRLQRRRQARRRAVGPVGSGQPGHASGSSTAPTARRCSAPCTLPTTVHAERRRPPTVADFDGTGKAQIGVATADYYWMLSPNFTTKTIDIGWKVPNHDYSSSVTGSTVFDFEGAGHPSVIYADECYLWVFDGATGAVRFSAPHTSFTGTEASLVADIDGSGRAPILMITNGADPARPAGAAWTQQRPGHRQRREVDAEQLLRTSRTAGLVAFDDSAHSWVGTRTLWNEHAYHVSNICDDPDSACAAPDVYGSIPKVEPRTGRSLAQQLPPERAGPGPVQRARPRVSLDRSLRRRPPCSPSRCATWASPRCPRASTSASTRAARRRRNQIGTVTTTRSLLPGQTEPLTFSVPVAVGNSSTPTSRRSSSARPSPRSTSARRPNNTQHPGDGQVLAVAGCRGPSASGYVTRRVARVTDLGGWPSAPSCARARGRDAAAARRRPRGVARPRGPVHRRRQRACTCQLVVLAQCAFLATSAAALIAVAPRMCASPGDADVHPAGAALRRHARGAAHRPAPAVGGPPALERRGRGHRRLLEATGIDLRVLGALLVGLAVAGAAGGLARWEDGAAGDAWIATQSARGRSCSMTWFVADRRPRRSGGWGRRPVMRASSWACFSAGRSRTSSARLGPPTQARASLHAVLAPLSDRRLHARRHSHTSMLRDHPAPGDLFFFVVESLRGDAIDPKTTPAMASLAREVDPDRDGGLGGRRHPVRVVRSFRSLTRRSTGGWSPPGEAAGSGAASPGIANDAAGASKGA